MTTLEAAAEQPTPPRPATASAVSLDERPLAYADLVARKGELVAHELVLGLRDGRAVVRANAALGLAAIGHTGRDLLPFLRDSDRRVAQAAAEAIAHLGRTQRAYLVAIAAALDGARPEVADKVMTMFADLVGEADAELVGVLDTADDVAANAVVEACARAGLRGLHLLQAAARDERTLVRLNAIRGVGRVAHLEPVSSIEVMHAVALGDSVSDVRAAAQAAIAAFIARLRLVAARKAGEPVPSAVPELRTRALTPDELKTAATRARLDELLGALGDDRAEIRLNAVRVLALQGAAVAADGAPALAIATRDLDGGIRAESVRALGALGAAGVVAAPALVRALGDTVPEVRDAAEAALADQGAAATAALVDGLEVASEPHGARVAALIGRLPDGPSRLREALDSTSVDVRVNAALGLGALGKARAGGALAALTAATRGGNARVRTAVARASAMIEPKPDRTLAPLAIDGFEQRVLAEPELARSKDALAAAGVAGLAPRLADARAVVRANTALALGVLGGDAGVVDALAVSLRDDDADVRMSAARGLARLGEPAVAACAFDLVRARRGADAALAAQLDAMLRGSAHPAIAAALVRGLESPDDHLAHHLCELLAARPEASDLLCEAFDRPGAQANVARGFVTLGKERLGNGRARLERARTDSSPRTRELARATLLAIDGPPAAPRPPAVAGFERDLLEKGAFAAAGPLDAGALLAFVSDGRAVVRANAATALGTLGPAAAASAVTIAALLRDDDERVRVAAARALEQLGDEAVVTVAPHLVSALRGDARLVEVCRGALAARGARVEAALIAGLETSDEVHGARVADLICALPNARELLFAAFDGEAQAVQINAAIGIGTLGATRAGPEGRRRLLDGLPGPPTRRRDAMVKALAMLGPAPGAR